MHYDNKFYSDMMEGAGKSAEALIPLVRDTLKPSSVLDVGCGTGLWLREWQKHGVEIFGVDGGWVKESMLEIDKDKFRATPLEAPLNLGRKFDLVMSLEVGEHIKPEKKNVFIDSLVRHGDIVLFSAAIPWQGGTDHFNEQWPSYWIEAFKQRDFVFLDPYRHLIWNNQNIKVHYRQNVMLFIKSELVEQNEFFKKERALMERSLVDVVHPDQFVRVRDPKRMSLKRELPLFVDLLINYLTKWFR